MGYYVKIHPDNPQKKQLEQVADVLKNGGVAIIPTDTVYALACDASSSKGLDKLTKLKDSKSGKTRFSFIFSDLSQLSQYTKQFDTATFKILKRALPGPYTFIMEASKALHKSFDKKKPTVGVRIPANNIPIGLVKLIGSPLAVTSFHISDEILEYSTDAELIYEELKHVVEVVVDGGSGSLVPSTIIDLTGGKPEIVRQGLGDIDILN